MKFEIIGKKEDLLRFKKGGMGVEFTGLINLIYIWWILLAVFPGSRILDEYEVLKEVLHITSVKNMSHAHAKFIFRRRIQYHISHTFLQVHYFSHNNINPIIKRLIIFPDSRRNFDWLFVIAY